MTTSTLSRAVAAEFAPETTYLNTSTCGLLPRRAVAAVKALVDENADGTRDGSGDAEAVERAREGFARIAGVPADRVAVGSSVSAHVGLIAASLPPGAEVLAPEGEFTSVVTPFAARGDLTVRYVPLEGLAGAVRPATALVALSSVQSADGRRADLDAVRAAARVHGARTLLDTTQSAGWLPLDNGAWDYTVTAGFKYLLCPRGASFLTVAPQAQDDLTPVHASWAAAARPGSTYGPVDRLADDARRFDESPAYLSYHGAAESLALLSEIGVAALHDHAVKLADRFRTGVADLGHPAVPADTVVVAVPGLGDRAPALQRAGVMVAGRAGNLRVSFHLYNTDADVDRALDALAG